MDVLIQLQRDTILAVNHLATIEQNRLDVELQRLEVEQRRLTIDVEQLASTKQLLRIKRRVLFYRKLLRVSPVMCTSQL